MNKNQKDHLVSYLQPQCCADGQRMWCQDPDPVDCEGGTPWTKYVRADLFLELEKAA